MEYLATIVFERTPAGAVAIKSAGDTVPRQLRTLLLAIDGRSPVSQYVPFLTALTPLSEKFAQLEVMGFARRKVSETAPATPVVAATLTERDLQALAQSLGSTANHSLATNPTPTAPVDSFEAQLQALAREGARLEASTSGVASGPAPAWAPPPVEPKADTAQPQLRDLLNEMQAFLSDAAGMEGLPVALMLEQITSLNQLRRELPSYGELVTSFGGDAAEHLGKLADMLARADR